MIKSVSVRENSTERKTMQKMSTSKSARCNTDAKVQFRSRDESPNHIAILQPRLYLCSACSYIAICVSATTCTYILIIIYPIDSCLLVLSDIDSDGYICCCCCCVTRSLLADAISTRFRVIIKIAMAALWVFFASNIISKNAPVKDRFFLPLDVICEL